MSINKKILLCTNSDIGRGNTIGFRFGKIAEVLLKEHIDFDVIARANYHKKIEVVTPVYRNILTRFFNALRIYILPNIDSQFFTTGLFDRFVLHQLKKKKETYVLAHFGEFLPKSISFLKEKGVRIFLDIPIGHDAYGAYLESRGIIFGCEKPNRYDFIDNAIALADVLIIPSEFVRKTLEMAGFGEKKMQLVPFGADIAKDFSVVDIQERAQQRPLTFLFAGNVNYRKGIPYLLEAWDMLQLPNAQLLIAGRVYKELKDNIKKYSLHNVTFLGFVNIKEYMRKSHVFVFPTLWEGSSKAVYEAMSYGLPVITTLNAGSIVENEKDGFIVPIADVDALREKMSYLAGHKNELVHMGEYGFEKVKQYSWKQYASGVIDTYKTLL